LSFLYPGQGFSQAMRSRSRLCRIALADACPALERDDRLVGRLIACASTPDAVGVAVVGGGAVVEQPVVLRAVVAFAE
jgi:hypothetical protein